MMADLFISYAREDAPKASAIAGALEAEGFSVFWDSEIPAGQTWADYIETKLRNSAAVLVLWSANSTQSQWVREEARMGRDAGKLIPVQLDGSIAPFGFGEVQAANLQNWSGDRGGPDWQKLVGAIRFAIQKAGQTPPPARPAPAAAMAAQPAMAAAGLAAAKPGGIKPAWILGGAALAVLLVGGGFVISNMLGGTGAETAYEDTDSTSESQTFADSLSASVAPMVDAALQAEADGNQAADEAANYYAQGAEAANAGLAGQAGYGSQQLPDGTVFAGDLAGLMQGGAAPVGVGSPNGVQFYGLYQQLTTTDYSMTGRGSMGSAVADGHWVYSASTFTFTGRSTVPGRFVVEGREQGPATGTGGQGLGVITYPDGSRYVGEYRSVGVGDQAQYLRNGYGAHYAATDELIESGRYENDNWVSAE